MWECEGENLELWRYSMYYRGLIDSCIWYPWRDKEMQGPEMAQVGGASVKMLSRLLLGW